jgi:hypothetical protein
MNPNNPANSNSPLGGGSFGNSGPSGAGADAGGSGGGVTHNHTHNYHINALDGASVASILHNNPDALASAMNKAMRGGHFNSR